MNKVYIKRPLCFLLSLIMVVGLYPFSILTAGSAVPTPFSAMGETKTSDPSTMNDYLKYFNTSSTEYAGGVWTDKSVFTDNSAFTSNGISLKNQDDFLVALSAMASNISVTGMATAPTDTMIVLDLSSSMYSSNASTVETMINTVNTTITSLQALNENNRVGVTVYYGSDTVGDAPANSYQVWLPLDRYTHSSNAFLKVTKTDQKLQSAGVNTNVYNSAGNKVATTTRTTLNSSGKSIIAGTYVQQGILSALEQFLNADTKVPSTASTQAGIERIPVMVLMSDGKPTAATNQYNTLGVKGIIGSNREVDRSPAETDFLTQLTASYAKEMMDAHYEAEPLLYTLSLGNGISYDVMDPGNTLKLNNGTYTNTIKNYWNSLIKSAGSININGTVCYLQKGVLKYKDITLKVDKTTITGKSMSGSANFPSSLNQQYYVDKAFVASTKNDLANTFEDIFTSISLQSKIYPTLVEGNANLSGYVSFVDKLGKYMEVKDIKGLLINNQLHTGANFAEHIIEHHANGNIALDPNDICYSFIDSVMQRLDISQETALTLISIALQHGQIAYNASTGEFSNYIGWFSDEDGKFLGPWYEGISITPERATHINHSYGFFGDTDVSHNISDHDMLYATVRVREEIATGFESVAFAVPAALIPTATYNVALDKNGNPTNLTLTGDKLPIRLVYEVGLESAINEITVQSLVTDAEYLAHHVNEKKNYKAVGDYEFFTNRFNHENITAYGTNNTYAYFSPSKENERYYYLSDSPVYSDQNGTLYTGSAKPEDNDGTYYRAVTAYVNNNGSFSKKTIYEQIMPHAFGYMEQKSGVWYVKAGTAHNYVENREVLKSSNNTASIDYSYHPFVDAQNNYVVGSVLGNNGRLILTPATGIKVTKTVDALNTDPEAPKSFDFTITNKTNSADSSTYKTYHISAAGVVTEGIITFSAGSATFRLKDGEKFYISGMTAGDQFTVNEEETAYYIAQNNNIGVTVASRSLAAAEFTNTARGKGNLTVAKEVAHDFGTGYQIPTDKVFNFEVTLSGIGVEEGKTFKAKHSGDSTVTAVTVGAGGKITFSLKHDEQFEIYDLPEGTIATVKELTPPAGFTASYKENNVAGDGIVTVKKDYTDLVEVVNTYKPEPVTAGAQLVIRGPKTFLNKDGSEVKDWGGLTFEAKLQKRVGDKWVDMGTATATESNPVFTFDFSKEEYTEAGVYAYQVFEIVPSNTEGILYDPEWHTFSVTVADLDMDGKLEITKVHSEHLNKDFEKVDGVWTVPTGFTNTKELLVPALVDIDIQKDLKNDSQSTLVNYSGYHFGIYTDAACTSPLVADGKKIVKIDSAYTDTVGEGWIDVLIGEAGDYTFYVKEIAGSINGMTYSDKVVKVEVEVTSSDGKLSASVAYKDATTNENVATNKEGELEFVNKYEPTGASLTLDVRKTLTGRDLNDNDKFTFEIRKTDGTVVAEGTNDASGKVTFDKELPFNTVGVFYYDVVETSVDGNGITTDKTPRRVIVTVVDKGGQLEATYVVETTAENYIVFNNTYNAEPVKHTIRGKKTLEGRYLLFGEFHFILSSSDKDGNVISGTSHSTENNADGTFIFPELEFTKAGDYYFVITEESHHKLPGITYDQTKYIVKITVKDNLEGNLEVETPVIHIYGNGTADNITFKNVYTPDAASGDITGNKVYRQEIEGQLTNKSFDEGTFAFSLYSSNENWEAVKLVERVSNKADGTFGFKTLTFDKAGTYYYLVNEYHGGTTVNGIVYDGTVYRIKVVVEDNKEGKLVATFNISDENNVPQSSIEFTNKYVFTDSDSVVISGIKILENKTLEAGKFEFVLTDVTDSSNPKVLETVTNNADGSFTFSSIKYDKAGTYTYTVKEVKGNLAGVTYDETVYTVTVTVTDDGNGKLVAHSNVSENGFIFTNTYTAEPTTVQISGNKELTGKDLSKGEFSFVITGNGVNETVTNDADGKFTFSTLTFDKVGTYTYTVSEVIGFAGGIKYDETKYTVTVTVTDNGNGKLAAEVSGANDILFNNSYSTDVTEVIFRGTKHLIGRNIVSGEFEFILEGSGEKQTVGVKADGSFAFSSIKYDKAGTYTYTVKEIDGKLTGVTYDKTVYNITVEVIDDGHGKLVATVSGADSITFTNKYKATETEIIFTGKKELTGRPLKAGEFSFVLKDANGNIIETVYNDADGVFTFHTIKYETEGEYTYTISEVNGSLGGVTYDGKEYTVTVKVTDDNTPGKLVATVTDPTPIVFKNTYSAAETTAQIGGKKILEGRDLKDGEFSFVITGNGVNETVTNDANGSFTFSAIKYTAAGSYTYTVSEIKENLPGIKYDETVYSVTVNVTDNGNGGLVAEVVGAANIVFNNSYSTTPDTVKFAGIKKLEGKLLAANEFSFILTDKITNTVIETVTNDASGHFSFSALTFTTAGTYYYSINELNGSRPEISYDTNYYNITVCVTDQGGALKCTYTITDTTGNETNNIVFNNKYNITSTSLQLTATKELAGRYLNIGEFNFVLTDVTDPNNKMIIETVTNGANGEIVFSAIEYESAGKFKYTIHETKGTLGGITYDTTIYAIDVTVTDNGNGTLSKTVKASYLIDSTSTIYRETSINSLKFKNKYESAHATLKIYGHKDLVGRDLKKGEFKFELRYLFGNQVLHTATNDENGTFSFPEIIYTTPGTHYYFVKEVNNNINGITYDDSEFIVYVNVIDNGNGKLLALATIPEFIGFTNYYSPTPASVEIKANKILHGRELAEGTYSFELKDSDGNVIETVKNKADGTIGFTALEFTKAGTYTYTVNEVTGNDPSILYDATVYNVKVTVTDNGEGQLTATVESDDIVFTNHALKPAQVTLDGIKYLDLVPTGGFNFVMKEGEAVIANSASNENGYFNFGTFVYDKEGTYTYTISEIAGDKDNIIYDTNVFTVTVTVKLEGTEYAATVKIEALIPLEASADAGIKFYNKTIPEETTVVPEETTTVPEETTVTPEETTVTPEDTTVTPEDTTVIPEDTTVIPEETTVAPEETTVSPDDSTETPNPETGDGNSVVIWLGAIIIAFCATAGALFSRKRETDNE